MSTDESIEKVEEVLNLSKKPPKLLIVAFVVALVSAALSSYAVSRVTSSTSSKDSTALVEDGDLFVAPVDLGKFISDTEKSVVEIFCYGTVTGFAYDIEVEDSEYKTVLVTNHHVVSDCLDDLAALEIYTFDEYENPAKFRVRGVDEENDVALLEIVEELPVLYGSEYFAQRCWWTMVIGNPVDTGFENKKTGERCSMQRRLGKFHMF